MEMKAWTWLKVFPSFDNSQKFFSALVTFYSKFLGYFSNLDFHVILHVILHIIDCQSFKSSQENV